MLYLNHINLATETDKSSGLDYWAEAFLASTWEDLKKLAEQGEVFRKVAEAMYEVNADVSQRSIAEAHRKYVETFTTLTNGLARAEKKAEEAERHLEAERQRANTAEQHAQNEKQRADTAERRADTAEHRADTAEHRADSAEQRAVTAEALLSKYKEKYGDL